MSRAMPDMHERRQILERQPQTKWIEVLHNNGTEFPVMKKHLVQMHHTKDMDHLTDQLTDRLAPKTAIRKLYTPAGGTEVTDMDQLQSNGAYVAAGRFFKPIPGVTKPGAAKGFKSRKSSDNSSGYSTTDSNSRSRRRNQSMPDRPSLISRQDAVARKARERAEAVERQRQIEERESVDESSRSTGEYSRRKKPNVKNLPKMPKNRKPLYPGAAPKAAAKSQTPETPEKKKKLKKKRQLKKAPLRRADSEPPKPRKASGSKSGERSGRRRSLTPPERYEARSLSRSRKKSVYDSMFSRQDSGRSRSRSRTPSVARSRGPSRAEEVLAPSRSVSRDSRYTHRSGRSRTPSPEDYSRSRSRDPSDYDTPDEDNHSRSNSRYRARSEDEDARYSEDDYESDRSGGRSSRNSRQSRRSRYSRQSSPAESFRSGVSHNVVDSAPSRSPTPSDDDYENKRSASPMSRIKSYNAATARSTNHARTKSRSKSPATRSEYDDISIRTRESAFDSRMNSSYRTAGGTRGGRRDSFANIPEDDGRSAKSSSRTAHRPVSRDRKESLNSVRSHHLTLEVNGEGQANEGAPSQIYSRSTSLWSYKSGSPGSAKSVRLVEVDLDTDGSGLYRAKHGFQGADAKEILDSSRTKIDLPVDLSEANEVDEELMKSLRIATTLHEEQQQTY